MMSTERVRAFIAIVVVGVFMLITGVMALFPLLSPRNVDVNIYADFFSKTASVYTGIVGVIIGYYFGRDTSRSKAGRDSATSAPDDVPPGGGEPGA